MLCSKVRTEREHNGMEEEGSLEVWGKTKNAMCASTYHLKREGFVVCLEIHTNGEELMASWWCGSAVGCRLSVLSFWSFEKEPQTKKWPTFHSCLLRKAGTNCRMKSRSARHDAKNESEGTAWLTILLLCARGETMRQHAKCKRIPASLSACFP